MRSIKPLFYIVLAVFVVVICYFFLTKWNKRIELKDANYWETELSKDKDRPYDISIFYRFFKTYNKPESFLTISNQKKLNDALNLSSNKLNGIYVFIGNDYYLSSLEVDSLLNYVEIGNSALIASSNLPEKLSNILYQTGGSWVVKENELDSLQSRFIHNTLNSKVFIFKHPFKSKPKISFSYRMLETGKSSAMYSDKFKYPYFASLTETSQGQTDFVRVPYGKGYFYIHFNPILFCNYYLSKDTGSNYIDAVLAHFNHRNVIWDEASRYYKIDGLLNNEQKQSIFYYLLSKPPLRAALFVFGFCVLAFLIFRTKRKQAIIPVISQKQNTSVEFTKTIGNYYYQENDILKVTKQKMSLFLGFVRFHYKLKTTTISSELIEAISQKSKVQKRLVTQIFEKYDLIATVGAIGNKNLAEFDHLLNEFYNNTMYRYGK